MFLSTFRGSFGIIHHIHQLLDDARINLNSYFEFGEKRLLLFCSSRNTPKPNSPTKAITRVSLHACSKDVSEVASEEATQCIHVHSEYLTLTCEIFMATCRCLMFMKSHEVSASYRGLSVCI